MAKEKTHITQEVFGKTEAGEDVIRFSLKNKNGVQLDVISSGATVVLLKCPDRDGKMDDIALGYDKCEDYLTNPPSFGASIGRVANRIANGRFTLDGKEYQLAINNPPNSLHGGWIGFSKVNWKSCVKKGKVKFTHISPDGDENYPGELHVRVQYALTDDNAVQITYKAITKAPTIVNLTNHTYFNLAGQGDSDVLDHVAQINAEKYLPTNDVQIPTGELCPVSSGNNAFNFTEAKPIGQDIPRVPGGGYDHNYCLPKSKGFCAKVYHPSSGRVLEMFTDQPGVQFYTANGLGGTVGKGGVTYKNYGAFCLEAQGYPDAINQPNFPSVVLRPGETYKQRTVYKLGVQE